MKGVAYAVTLIKAYLISLYHSQCGSSWKTYYKWNVENKYYFTILYSPPKSNCLLSDMHYFFLHFSKNSKWYQNKRNYSLFVEKTFIVICYKELRWCQNMYRVKANLSSLYIFSLKKRVSVNLITNRTMA